MKRLSVYLFLLLFMFQNTFACIKYIFDTEESASLHTVFTNYDIYYYKFDLEFTDSSTYVSGNTEFYFNWLRGDTMQISLSNKLSISEIRLNDSIIQFTHIDNTITFTSNFVKDKNFHVDISYNGDGNADDFRGAVLHAKVSDSIPVTYTLSEPFGSSSWMPTNNNLTDKIDSADILITTPDYMKAGSNGLLIAIDSLANNKVKYHWKTIYPQAFYLFSVAVSDYIDYTTKAYLPELNDTLLFVNYLYNNNSFPTIKTSIDCTVAIIKAFSQLYGNYPFINEKYGHCMAPIGGGMEHQTMTTISDFGFSLVAHELAHQWFGDHVTCKSWKDIWINEGFATYSEYLAYEYFEDSTSAFNWLVNATTSAKTADGNIYLSDEESEDISSIFSYSKSYLKGALCIHMLRGELNNDTLFFRVLKEFQKSNSHTVAGIAEFKLILEEVSQRNFDTFFNQWFYSPGYPMFYMLWEQKNDSLYIYSEQVPYNSDSTMFFDIPLPFQLTIDNKDSLVTYRQTNQYDTFKIKIEGYIDKLQVNPNLSVLLDVLSIEKIDNAFTEDSMFVIYPNPVSDNLTIRSKEENITFTAEIFDLSGKKIQRIPKNIGVTNVDISNLSNGVYHVFISAGKKKSNFAFIKN